MTSFETVYLVSLKLHLRDGRTEVRPSLRWSLTLTYVLLLSTLSSLARTTTCAICVRLCLRFAKTV